MASRQVHNGISLRVVRQYDINNDRLPCRIDVLYGYSTIRPQMAVRMWGLTNTALGSPGANYFEGFLLCLLYLMALAAINSVTATLPKLT
jgi:hypothetical protein